MWPGPMKTKELLSALERNADRFLLFSYISMTPLYKKINKCYLLQKLFHILTGIKLCEKNTIIH